MQLAWLSTLCLVVHCSSVRPIPSSNYVRFKAIDVERPLESRKASLNRRLEGTTLSRIPNPIAEYGIARKFAPGFDDRFSKKGQSKPYLKHLANSSPEACAQSCVETEKCRSWHLDEKMNCHLYYVTVRGYPLRGAVSGEYNPPTVTINDGFVTNLGGHACICGSQEALSKATAITTRENLLARMSNKLHDSHRIFNSSFHGYPPERNALPDGSMSRALHGNLTHALLSVHTTTRKTNRDEGTRYSILADMASNTTNANQVRFIHSGEYISSDNDFTSSLIRPADADLCASKTQPEIN